MAKVTIAGNSYVITSTVSMADLEMVKKYRPSALVITDPETKEALFRVGISAGSSNLSSISDYGICFGGVSNDHEKLAAATLSIPADAEDAKEYVLDKVGLALVNLEKVEAEVVEVLTDIRAERDSVAQSIRVSV